MSKKEMEINALKHWMTRLKSCVSLDYMPAIGSYKEGEKYVLFVYGEE